MSQDDAQEDPASLADWQQRLFAKERELEEFQRDTAEYERELEAEIKRFELDKTAWDVERARLEEELHGMRVA